jgi:hypothetical protein
MFQQITKILARFFSIFGGYSTPEDLRRAKLARAAARRPAPEPPKR